MTAPSHTAWLFARSAEWLIEATTPRADDRVKLAALIRAKVRRGFDAAKATRIRQAIKRITDAFTWGALEKDDYRQQLLDLRAQLAVLDRADLAMARRGFPSRSFLLIQRASVISPSIGD